MRLRDSDCRAQGDDGAILVLALLFIGVVAVLITSVISISTTGVRAVAVDREYVAKRYAADAGLKFAVQQVRAKSEYCGTASPSLQPPTDLLTSNGGPFTTNTPTPSLNVTCTATGGTRQSGAAGYALIVNDPSPQGITIIANTLNRSLSVQGPTFIASHPASLALDVTKGDYWTLGTSGPSCPGLPSGASLETPPYVADCQPTAPAPPITLPDAIPTSHGASPDRVVGDCAIFGPGSYTAIDLTTYPHIYLASGVYYFDNVNFDVVGRDVFAGRPLTLSDILTGGNPQPKPCSNDLAASGIAGVSGTGVKIILGGTARIFADNPGGVLEIYARAGGGTAEGTQDVSVMDVPATLPPGAPAWDPSSSSLTNPSYSTVRFGVGNNANPGGGQNLSLGVHGLVYLPDAGVALRSDSSESRLEGGLVAGRLTISTSNGIGGFAIGANQYTTARQLHVTSTATGAGAGDKPLVATADVVVDDKTHRVYFASWQNRQ
jgi:hypothetical protein